MPGRDRGAPPVPPRIPPWRGSPNCYSPPMLDNGCNLAGDVPTLADRIEDRGEGPGIESEPEPVAITAEQALSADARDPDWREERAEFDDWLRSMLADGPALQSDVMKAGRDAGFSESAPKRSKRRRLDVQPIRPDLADALRPWLASKPTGAPVFPIDSAVADFIRTIRANGVEATLGADLVRRSEDPDLARALAGRASWAPADWLSPVRAHKGGWGGV